MPTLKVIRISARRYMEGRPRQKDRGLSTPSEISFQDRREGTPGWVKGKREVVTGVKRKGVDALGASRSDRFGRVSKQGSLQNGWFLQQACPDLVPPFHILSFGVAFVFHQPGKNKSRFLLGS